MLKKVRKQHWFKGKLYIIENVDAEVCEECGERYFHASTLDRIDEPARAGHAAPLTRSVCVANGHTCPEICTPQELMGVSEDG